VTTLAEKEDAEEEQVGGGSPGNQTSPSIERKQLKNSTSM